MWTPRAQSTQSPNLHVRSITNQRKRGAELGPTFTKLKTQVHSGGETRLTASPIAIVVVQVVVVVVVVMAMVMVIVDVAHHSIGIGICVNAIGKRLHPRTITTIC